MFDQLYHYSVGQRKTTDKLQAILWANEKNEWIHFHTPKWLKDLPIHMEPEDSMETLCVKRARRIREENKHIKLWFSGGCDSEYMLRTFVDNGIHVDEIYCNKFGIPEADWEIDKVALPYLNSIKDKIRKTKVTVREPNVSQYKDFYKDDYWFENYINNGRNSQQFTGIRPEYWETINQHDARPGTVNLIGSDKPHILFVNGEWYQFTLDVQINQQTDTGLASHCGFYNGDPLIFIKQCHMLKRGIESRVKDAKDYNKVCFYSGQFQHIFNESIGRVGIGKTFIRKDLAPTNTRFTGINRKELIGKQFIHDNFPEVYRKYKNGLENLNNAQNGRWFHDKSSELGTIGIFAELKSLHTNTVKTIDELYPNGFKI
jgi:hypothetical protein